MRPFSRNCIIAAMAAAAEFGFIRIIALLYHACNTGDKRPDPTLLIDAVVTASAHAQLHVLDMCCITWKAVIPTHQYIKCVRFAATNGHVRVLHWFHRKFGYLADAHAVALHIERYRLADKIAAWHTIN